MSTQSRRLRRILRIVTMLQSGGRWSTARLACECGVCERTIFRDLNALSDADIPYYYDRESGSYRVRRDYYLRPPQLSAQEALALICLGRQVGGEGQIPYFEAAGAAADKLTASLPPPLRDAIDRLAPHVHVRLCRGSGQEAEASLLSVVCDAISNRRVLAGHWRHQARDDGRPTAATMHLDPYALVFHQPQWHVVGRHHEDRCVRCLSLSSLGHLACTPQRFVMPGSFSPEPILADGWNPGTPQRTWAVELRIAGVTAERVAAGLWHPTQDIRWHGDDSITFRCSVTDLGPLRQWVADLRSCCTVVRPRGLRRQGSEHLPGLPDSITGRDAAS